MRKRIEIPYRPVWTPGPIRHVGGKFDPANSTFNYVINHLRGYVPDDIIEFARKLDEFTGTSSSEGERAFEPLPVEFGPKDPSCFWEEEGGQVFRGNEGAKRRIDIAIASLTAEERFKALLTGPAGTGKSTLALIIAARLFEKRTLEGIPPGAYYQILPAQVGSKEALDTFMHELVRDPYAFVFIDEVHDLVERVGVEVLLHTLQDTATPRYPLQGGQWLDVPGSISWVAATTDPGKMDNTTGGALRRRLNPVIRLEAPGTEELKHIILDQGFPIHPDAAWDAARRCNGLPWMAVHLQQEMRKVALSRGEDEITPTGALETFEILGLDELGVTIEDRLVMKTLMCNPRTLRSGEKRYAMSESALCAATGVDPSTYRTEVQPRLFKLGLLTVLSGQCLTDKALTAYGHLAEED